MTRTRRIAIAVLGLVLLAMWLAIVFNAQSTVPLPVEAPRGRHELGGSVGMPAAPRAGMSAPAGAG
jgi:hypothetical protein